MHRRKLLPDGFAVMGVGRTDLSDAQFRENMTEALKLVDSLHKKNVFADSDYIEIGVESYGLTMHVDGDFIKVGYGNYSDKFERWKELEPEIRRRGVPIKYVDLRFKDSVIVKPEKKRKKGKTS